MNRKEYWLMLGLAMVVGWVMLDTLVFASGDELGRPSLRGLQAVCVVVEDINPEAERDGVNRDRLQTDTELRLRKAVVKVLSDEEVLKAEGRPCLYVKVTALEYSPIKEHIFFIGVELWQYVTLVRDPKIRVGGMTWSTKNVGLTSPQKLMAHIREEVANGVDEFINAYLAMNPKEINPR